MSNEQIKQQSISILNKYKDEISKEAYERIIKVISNHSIEAIVLTKEDIYNLVRVEKGEITTNKLIKEIKQRYQKRWEAA